MGAVEHACGLVGSSGLGDGAKLEGAGGEHSLGQRSHKVEDAAGSLLVLTEGLVVHKEVDNLAGGVLIGNPTCILVGGQRPLAPTLIGEAEGDVVAELVVPQQHAELLVQSVGIDKVGTLPTQDVLGTLGQHCLEAHRGHHLANLVGVDELGVAERGGGVAKLLLDESNVLLHLALELLGGDERREGVGVGLGEELHATRCGQLTERVEHLGGVAAELLDCQTRDGESHLEGALILADEAEQEVVHREIALRGHTLHNDAVGGDIEIVVVLAHIEEPIGFEPQRLVNLKV